MNLQKLNSLYIPEAITSIDMKCISVGSSLSSIKVAENHPRYDSRNNCNAIIETATNKYGYNGLAMRIFIVCAFSKSNRRTKIRASIKNTSRFIASKKLNPNVL